MALSALIESVPVLASQVGITRQHCWAVLAGKAGCSRKLAKRIEAATHGSIRAVWLLGLEDPPDHCEASDLKATA